jgi:hypothetical protein
MAIHDKLPIHKTGSQLLGVAARIHEQMRRGLKRTVGDKIVDHCTQMLDQMALANASRGARRIVHIEDVLAHQRSAEVWLRVGLDLKCVSPGLWGEAIQLTQSVGRQAGGWKGKTNEKAPAA